MRRVFLYALQGLMVLAMPVATGDALAESLSAYAAKCDAQTKILVNAFNCMTGYEIEMKGTPGDKCEKPPYLPSAGCRAGSRLGVQTSTQNDVAVVWLCRKKTNIDRSNSIFDDIAVIQTNFTNGATCFYQRLQKSGVDGSRVPAPSTDTGNFWFQPARTKDEQCASCHDTGLLRTPYLTQVVDKDGEQVLPKRRHRINYWFPGEDFVDWNGKVFKIRDSADPKNCTRCHPMGGNTIDPNSGTSTWLGLMATGETPTPHLNPPSDAKAYWMQPDRKAPSQVDKTDALRMRECALGNFDRCGQEPWGRQIEAIIDALRGRTLPELKQPVEE